MAVKKIMLFLKQLISQGQALGRKKDNTGKSIFILMFKVFLYDALTIQKYFDYYNGTFFLKTFCDTTLEYIFGI